jgi:hypothetical protein
VHCGSQPSRRRASNAQRRGSGSARAKRTRDAKRFETCSICVVCRRQSHTPPPRSKRVFDLACRRDPRLALTPPLRHPRSSRPGAWARAADNRNALRPSRTEGAVKVETAGSKGAKFAVPVRRFGRGQWPSCGRDARLRPTVCGRLGLEVDPVCASGRLGVQQARGAEPSSSTSDRSNPIIDHYVRGRNP